MRPVPVPWVLRIHSRPYRGSMQCQLHAINKQVEIRPILTIMKPRVMHHLADDLLDPTPYAVKHPVVPSLERQTTTRAVALCTSRQVPVEDTTELVLLVFYQAESRGKRVNSTYNRTACLCSHTVNAHYQCGQPNSHTTACLCNHTANAHYQCGQPWYAGSPRIHSPSSKFSWPRFQLLLKILESEGKVHSHVKL